MSGGIRAQDWKQDPPASLCDLSVMDRYERGKTSCCHFQPLITASNQSLIMTMRQYLLIIALWSFSVSSAQEELVWTDEFNKSDGPNSTVWSYETGSGGDGELQEYKTDNVKEEQGRLVITAVEDTSFWDFFSGGRKFTSGKISSQGKLEVLYGRIEARIEVPDPANGLWPSLWMVGSNVDDVGLAKSGRMTMMQMGSARALEQGQGKSLVESSLYWEQNNVEANNSDSVLTGSDLTEGFHTYVMDWTPESISTFVDGTQILTKDISTAGCPECDEFHQPFFFILSLAVGGSYPNINDESGVTASFPAEMLVDSIRVYDNGFAEMSGSGFSSPIQSSPSVPPNATVSTAMPGTTTTPATSVLPTEATTEAATTTSSPPPSTTVPTTPETPTTTAPTTAEPETTVPPTTPSTTDTTPAPTSSTTDPPALPVQTVEAVGMVMSLTDVPPLNDLAQADWVEITRGHLMDEAKDSFGFEKLKVNVTMVSQNPPYTGNRRLLRHLQASQQQKITFNAIYAVETSLELDDVTPIISSAFESNGQKARYLEKLKNSGDDAFQSASFVSVESPNIDSAKDADPGSSGRNSTNIGFIVGLVIGGLVLLVIGVALFVRRRNNRPAEAPKGSTDASVVKGPMMDLSGTVGDETLYTGHPKHEVTPDSSYDNDSVFDVTPGITQANLASAAPNSTHDKASSLHSSYRSDADESYGGFSSELSALDIDYNYRDAYWSTANSVISGPLDNASVATEEQTVCDEFTVMAPKGMLGLTLQTCAEGCPVVHEIKEGSPLAGQVQVGDRLHCVDGRDVTMVQSDTVSRVIASKANCESRALTFARPKK